MNTLGLEQVQNLLVQNDAYFSRPPENMEVLKWEAVEGDEEGEEHLQVEYIRPDTTCVANISSATFIPEVLQYHQIDLALLSPRNFEREDRDELVAKMYKALERT